MSFWRWKLLLQITSRQQQQQHGFPALCKCTAVLLSHICTAVSSALTFTITIWCAWSSLPLLLPKNRAQSCPHLPSLLQYSTCIPPLHYLCPCYVPLAELCLHIQNGKYKSSTSKASWGTSYIHIAAIYQQIQLVVCRSLSYRPNESFLTEDAIAISLKWWHSLTATCSTDP